VSAAVSRSDTNAYFNYTSYEQGTLRSVRARLLGEWRAASRVSLLGEFRVDNGTHVEAAAWYLRWRPSATHDLDVQIGRIPPVIGAFPRHAYGRDNIVIGAPLAYQYLTSLRPDALPASSDDLLRMRARGWQPVYPLGSQDVRPGVPLVSSFSWDTGAEVHWREGILDLAGALTRGAPSSPAELSAPAGPTISGRAAVAPAPGLTVGVSAARGRWVQDALVDSTSSLLSDRTHQQLLGADLEYGLARWLVRAEWLRSRFEMPVAALPTLEADSGFVEGRYRWTPRWQTSARVERLTFSRIAGAAGTAPTPWDAPVTRVEAVLGFRAARNLEIRGGWQQDWRAAGRIRDRGYPALQALFWF
jgi:hypothetical protein